MTDLPSHRAPSADDPFDLTPDPRVLVMLGEINLDPWRCVAELVDNCLDNFLSEDRAGEPLLDPTVWVTTPTTNDPAGRVTVRDNGSGMQVSVLEKAVRAGWSGNDPVGSLGLFGMGFNIATARLGSRTTVWTARI
jgi:C4-dicarboxylate-specific signal transduction histidine kinase